MIVDVLQLIAVHYLLVKRIPKIPDGGDHRRSDERKEILKQTSKILRTRQSPSSHPH